VQGEAADSEGAEFGARPAAAHSGYPPDPRPVDTVRAMPAELIVVPYDLGREGVGMGAGPLALEAAAVQTLAPDRVERIGLSAPFANEVGSCFDLNRQVARAVASARRRNALPVVLTGNCHTQQAVVAGLGADDLTLVWLDCHADFHTPETTESGFFDGTALSMTLGDCWTGLCATVPGFEPLPAERVVLAGVRDVETGERRRLDASKVIELTPGGTPRLGTVLPPARRVSLHVDLDVLDPGFGRANQHAVAPGLSPAELLDVVRAVVPRARLAALTLSAYDPEFDHDGAVRTAALAVLREAGRTSLG
jgi:arginase